MTTTGKDNKTTKNGRSGSIGRLTDRARSEGWAHEEYLAACLQREVAARDSHGAEGRIRAARFPRRSDLPQGRQLPHARPRPRPGSTRQHRNEQHQLTDPGINLQPGWVTIQAPPRRAPHSAEINDLMKLF